MGRSSSFMSTWLLAGAVVMFASLSLVHWGFSTHWHDQQRVGQIVFILLCGLSAVFLLRGVARSPLVSREVHWLTGVILILGLISVAQARLPMWALMEFSLQLGCAGIVWWVALVRSAAGAWLDRFLAAVVFVVCGLHVWQFMTAYVAFAVTNLGAGDPWLLLSGFSNPRFYGQFITLSLPLLALPLVRHGVSRRQLCLSMILLSCWWALAFISGTRGTWLGLACAMLVMFFVGGVARRWVTWLALGALIGILWCWLAVSGIPSLLDVGLTNHPGDRLNTNLTRRGLLWGRALDLIWMYPWLGVGPMHFADQFKSAHEGLTAHPHHAFLQWASEWGLPSALLVSWLICRGCFRVVRAIARHGDVSAKEAGEGGLMVCVFGAVLASLVQGMVDGVFVMPYTETWLAILAGWLWGIYSGAHHPGVAGVNHSVSAMWRWMLLAAGCVLMFAVVRDLPRLDERVNHFAEVYGGPLMPRFWIQGIISHEK